jgi:hypothetical protein
VRYLINNNSSKKNQAANLQNENAAVSYNRVAPIRRNLRNDQDQNYSIDRVNLHQENLPLVNSSTKSNRKSNTNGRGEMYDGGQEDELANLERSRTSNPNLEDTYDTNDLLYSIF